MSLKYLLDENIDPIYQTQLLRHNSSLVVLAVGESDTPAKGTLDPEILCWCEEHNFVLVTNNRSSMPIHLAEHITQVRHVPGILILNANLSIGHNIVIAEASFDEGYQDRIEYLPLS